MHVRRWNINKVSLTVAACLVLYVFFSTGYNRYDIDAVIKDTKPEEVWEYVGDFSKMRLLNPTILDFRIIADSGNTHNWRYSVLYTERLSYWPYWQNTAVVGHFVLTKSMPGVVPPILAIESKHETCFFRGIYCLRAESEFKFTAMGKDTYCKESIQYQCPPFLSHSCHRELDYQRRAVMHNLTTIFARKHNAN